MRIYNMMIEVLLILLGHFGEHLVKLVLHALALNDAVGGFVNLALQIGYVLHRHVGIGVRLAGRGGVVGRLAVLVHVVDAFLDETCLGVLLAIQDVGLCLGIVAVLHQCKLHTVLDFLDGESVAHRDTLTQVGGYAPDFVLIKAGNRLERPNNGILNFGSVKFLPRAVSFNYDHGM